MGDISLYYYGDIDSWSDNVLRWQSVSVDPQTHPIADPEKIHEYLNQTKIWIDSDKIEHKIKDMDKRYLFNVLSWFDNNYGRINFTYEFIARLEDTFRYDSLIDLEKTPLYLKLKSRYKKLLIEEKG